MTESDEDDAPEPARSRPPRTVERSWVTVALVVAVAALLLVIAVPALLSGRPSGPVAARVDLTFLPSGIILAPAPACTGIPGAQVTITVPGAGTIVVSATGRLLLNHTFGVEDTVGLFLANATGSCTYPFAWIGKVPASFPTERFVEMSYAHQTAFTVAQGGTYTLYLNGHMWRGSDTDDRLLTASVVAVFYGS